MSEILASGEAFMDRAAPYCRPTLPCNRKRDVHPEFLPPYTPQINPVETVRRDPERRLAGRFFWSNDEPGAAVTAILERQTGSRPEGCLIAWLGPPGIAAQVHAKKKDRGGDSRLPCDTKNQGTSGWGGRRTT